MHAPGSTTFEDHWKNPAVQDLLRKPWDHVVLQGASAETIFDDSLQSFETHGAKLARQARKVAAKTWLYVTWQYEPGGDFMREYPRYEGRMQDIVQQDYLRLSKNTGVPLINVGKAWRKVYRDKPAFALYEADGNHATKHGAYLTALVIFGELSGLSPKATTFRPSGMTEADAAYLRAMAAGS